MNKNIVNIRNLDDMVNVHNVNMNWIDKTFKKQAKTNRNLKLVNALLVGYLILDILHKQQLELKIETLEKELADLNDVVVTTIVEEGE